MESRGMVKVQDECASDELDENGRDFFALIADVDNIACDVSVSKEESVATMRSIKGATLPALLRRLTSIETTTQSQILTFLLNMKDIECDPFVLIQFLTKRFTLTTAKVDAYASSVRSEIIALVPSENTRVKLKEIHEGEVLVFEESNASDTLEFEYSHNDSGVCSNQRNDSDCTCNGDSDEHWLLHDRSVIGSQFYWHCSPEELAKHDGDRIAEEALRLIRKNLVDIKEETSTDSIVESSGGSTPLAVLSTLTSVQVGVLLFLETWLNLVPEDFMLCMCTLNSDTKTAMTTTNCDDDFKRPFSSFSWSDSDEKNSYFSDVLDVLVNFINILSQDRTLTSLGLCQNEQHDDRPSVEISPGSLLSDHFPCVSKLIVLVNDNFELEVEEGDKTLVSHEDRDVVNDKCDSGVKKESPELVANAVEDVELTLPPEPVLSTVSPKRSHIPRPLSLNPKDQGYYKHQLERVFTGEIKDRESLTSLRMSFFDTFGDDSLSEILEFESEVAGNLGDARPESWKNYVAPKSRFENTSTAIANENISQIDNVDDTSKSSTVSQVASGSSAGADSFDGISFFKSLFQKSNAIEKVDNAPNEIADDVSVGKLVVSESSTSDILPQDSHVIALSSKSKECPSTGKRPLLFVPQDLVPSALAAASMGIRVSTLAPRTSSRESPLNIPLGFCDTNFISPKNKPISESEISLVLPKSTRSHYKYAASLRSLVVRTLAKVNEDSFTSCIEMYSYFGMMLSAVELRTAQDYVASSDLSMEIEVPARLFVDPIDRYIIRYNSTDALSSEKISYLVKSSREESELLPVENVREITPPSADRTRTPVSSHSTSDASSLYVYDPDFNNSSSATDQQNKRNKHRKEQRRRTMGSYLSQRVADYSKKSSSRRQTILSSENSRRISGSKTSSPPKSEVGGRRTSFSSSAGSHSMSSRSSSFSMSEALFGSSHVYLGPSIFLDFQIYQVAANLTMRLHYMFCTIPMLEFVVDYVYAYDAKSNIRNRTPMLTRFRKESEKLQTLFIGEVLVHPDVSTRAEVVIKMIKVAEHLAKMRSHHALMLVVYALHTHAIYRLKSTWAVVHAKLPGRWDVLTELVGMGGNKLVAFFCQRQPRNGISNDVREEMFLELDKPLLNRHNECEDCSNDRSASRDSNDKNSRYDNFHFERLRLGEVPISPKRRVHTYSSDSNSSLGYSDSTVEEEQRDTSPADNDDDVVHQGGESVFGNVCDVNNGDEVSPFSTTSACFSKKDADDKKERDNNKHLNIPISMKIIDLRKCDFANECQKQNDRPRVGFHFMASGLPSQPSSSAADKILSYESTSSLASLAGSSGKIRDKEDESFPVVAKVKAPVNDNWQVEKSTKVGPSAESENIEVFSDTESDTPSSVASSIENTEIKLPMTSSIEDSNVRSNQTVDILMSFSGDEETTREAAPIDPGPVSYRYLQVRSLSLRPPQSGLGEVKSDGLTSSHAFSGMPIASQKPFMPFLNGILQKIIRLNELPNFLRSQCASGHEQNSDDTNEQGFLWVQSPGNSSTDPKLMMINFGKFRSISNLLMLIRSSQLTPFSLHVDFAVQAMLYRDAMYKSEDDIWDRSSELE